MKFKKKLLAFYLATLAFLALLFSVDYGEAVARAEEVSSIVEQSSVTEAENSVPDAVPPAEEPPADEPIENPTFFGRIWEYVTTNYSEIISTVSVGAFGVLVAYIKSKFKKNDSAVTDAASKMNGKQESMIGAMNELITNFNGIENMLATYQSEEADRCKAEAERFKEEVERFKAEAERVKTETARYQEETEKYKTETERYKLEEERLKQLDLMMTQVRAVLDILATVYPNSKNLPQGVKDLISLKYADAVKAVQPAEDKVEGV